MNTLILYYDHHPSEFMEAQKVLWEFKNKDRYKNFQVDLVYGLGSLFFVGSYYWADGKISFFLVLSAIMILNAFLKYLQLRKRRNLYLHKMSEESERFIKIQLKYNFEFTNKQLRYKDDEKTINLDWKLLQHYTVYKGFVVVGAKTGMINHIFKIEEENPEYQQIKEFIDQKLVQRVL